MLINKVVLCKSGTLLNNVCRARFNYSTSLYTWVVINGITVAGHECCDKCFFLLSMLTKCPNLLGTAENITLRQKQGLVLRPHNIISTFYNTSKFACSIQTF